MPLCLRNATDAFQRVLETILSGVRWKKCLVDLSDVVIFLKNNYKHINDTDEVLTQGFQVDVNPKLPNCFLF